MMDRLLTLSLVVEKQCSMALPKSPLPLQTKFSSLENLKSSMTVEISFHDLFLTCIVTFLYCFTYLLLLLSPILCVLNLVYSSRAYSSPYRLYL